MTIKPFPKNPFKLMFMYAWLHKWLLSAILLSAILEIFSAKIIPYLFARLIALFGADTDFNAIKYKFFIILGLIFVAGITQYVVEMLGTFLAMMRLRPIVRKELSADLFAYLMGHSVGYYADNMAGSLAQKWQDLADDIPTMYRVYTFYAMGYVSLLFTFGLLMTASVKLSLMFAVTLAIATIILWKVSKFSINLRSQMTECRNRVTGNMIDAMQNSFFVRLFNGFDFESRRVRKLMEEENRVTNKSVNIETLQGSGEKLFFQIVCMGILFYGIWLWHTGQMSGADVVMTYMLLQSVASTVSFLLHRAVIYAGEIARLKKDLEPFATPHNLSDKENAKALKISEGAVKFDNITFAYSGQKPVFKNFSLEIKPHEKVGLVGVSGSGKSTLVNLLLRLYDLQSGSIKIDGQNIADVTQDSLRKAVGYVPQTAEVMEISVADNIAYADTTANKKQIKQAAQKAYADDFIEALPQKYNTILNAENKLSGGQQQRIGIARAFLKNAPLLVLDEATSALDSESELYIQKAVDALLKNKTVLVIAHRLSTLKNMDRIVVLEKGKIVEEGTFAELEKKKGRFAAFWKLQQMKGGNND